MLVLLKGPDSVMWWALCWVLRSALQSGQERGQGLEMHLAQKMALLRGPESGWMLALLRGPDSVPRLEMQSVQETGQGEETM